MLQRRSIKRSRTEDNLALLDASARGRVPFGAQHRRNSQLSITAVHYSDEAEESDGIGYDSDTQLGTRRRKSGRLCSSARDDGKSGLTIVQALTSLRVGRGGFLEASELSPSAEKEDSTTSSSGGHSSELEGEVAGTHSESVLRVESQRPAGSGGKCTRDNSERREAGGSWRSGGLPDVPEVISEEALESSGVSTPGLD